MIPGGVFQIAVSREQEYHPCFDPQILRMRYWKVRQMLFVFEEVAHRRQQEPFALLHCSMSRELSERRELVYRGNEMFLHKLYEHEDEEMNLHKTKHTTVKIMFAFASYL